MAGQCSECQAEWHILLVVYIEDGDVPALGVTKQAIQFAAKIDASIGFDIDVFISGKWSQIVIQ